MAPETVSISLPALPEYVQTVRLVVAGLASRLKFTIDEIEDLKIGVDELCAYLTGPHGRPGVVRIKFEIGADYLAVSGQGELEDTGGLRSTLTELSRQILETVADEASLKVEAGRWGFFLRKAKSVGSRAGATS